MGDSSDNQVAKVKSDKLEAVLTCPICKQLYNEATSINECMHAFCKQCIYDKIIQEGIRSCPVCNISLGCTPLDKLRVDHNLQSLRAKLFPLKGNKSKKKTSNKKSCEVDQPRDASEEVPNKSKDKGKGIMIKEERRQQHTPLYFVPSKSKDKRLEVIEEGEEEEQYTLPYVFPNRSKGKGRGVVIEDQQRQQQHTSLFVVPNKSKDKGKGKLIEEEEQEYFPLYVVANKSKNKGKEKVIEEEEQEQHTLFYVVPNKSKDKGKQKLIVHEEQEQHTTHLNVVQNKSKDKGKEKEIVEEEEEEQHTPLHVVGNKINEKGKGKVTEEEEEDDTPLCFVRNKSKAKGKQRVIEEEEEEDTPLWAVLFGDSDSDYDPKKTKKGTKSNKKTVRTNKRSRFQGKKSFPACRKRPVSPGHSIGLEDETQILAQNSVEERVDNKQVDEAIEASNMMSKLCLNPPLLLLQNPTNSNPSYKGKEKVAEGQEIITAGENPKLPLLPPPTPLRIRRSTQRGTTVFYQTTLTSSSEVKRRRTANGGVKSEVGSSSNNVIDLTKDEDDDDDDEKSRVLLNACSNIVEQGKTSGGEKHDEVMRLNGEGSNVDEKEIVHASIRRPEGFPAPVWIHLVAAEDQQGDAPLPQLQNPYISTRRLDAPISAISKYLAKKFNLISENEVELRILGHLISPSADLKRLLNVWGDLNPKEERFMAIAGTSAEDVVMKLSYARRYLHA